MAKFNVEFDSITKSLVVMRDGEVLDSVDNVELFRAYTDEGQPEKFYLRLVRTKKDKEHDIYQTLTVTASEFKKNVYESTIEEAMAERYGVGV